MYTRAVAQLQNIVMLQVSNSNLQEC